ncbi:CD99 antigen-like protein 2 [Symphorus nematophorus]
MANRSLWSLCLLLALLLPLEVLSQDLNLSDALSDLEDGKTYFSLDDAIDDTPATTKAPPKVVPKVPAGTKAPAKPQPKPAADDFDLADALDPKNDIGGKDKNKGKGGGISDDDLLAVSEDESYKPDKGKGGRSGDSDQINQYDDNGETTAEVGTIAGIASAVAMALVGAISSYISYQKKKLCFSIQQSLNTDMVKAENPEAVVATEPQVQQTLLEPANAEPPTEENAV